MKRQWFVSLAFASAFVMSDVRAATFADIQFWVGSGTNQAAFEIDWNDGTPNAALVWGYRWNGNATGEQMFDAIVTADPRLYAEVSGATQYGTELFGLGFHQSGDQNFPLNPPLAFNSQHLAYTDGDGFGVDDSRAPVDAGDRWQEGWFTAGYWSYYLSTDSRLSANASDWDSSGTSMTGRALTNGAWDGYSFAYDFSGPPPANPAAATLPAPSIAFWVGTGTNHAGFEIDWNDGTPNAALAWGYRWNGNATGGQMFDAIVAADPRLYAEVSGATQYGTELFGLGFHQSGDQNFPLNPPLAFNSQHLAYTDGDGFGVDDSRAPVDAGDRWQEGWFTAGYWSYYLSTDSQMSTNSPNWTSSGTSMTGRVLTNASWDGYSFAYDFSGPPPAIPEAATLPAPSLSIGIANSQPAISWPTWAASYNLQQSASLSSGNWTTVTNGIGVNGSNFYFYPAVNSAGFFRLQQ